MPFKNAEDRKKSQAKYYQGHKPESNHLKDSWRSKHPERVLLNNAKSRAKGKGFEFSIEESDIVIPETCPVLGIPLVSYHGEGKKGWGCKPDTPTLDRIDNTKGYIKGNIWVISWRANRIKSDATIEELELLVAAIHNKT